MSGSAELTKFAPRVVLPAQLCSILKAHQACFFIRQWQLTFPVQLLERTVANKNGGTASVFVGPVQNWPINDKQQWQIRQRKQPTKKRTTVNTKHKQTTTTTTNKTASCKWLVGGTDNYLDEKVKGRLEFSRKFIHTVPWPVPNPVAILLHFLTFSIAVIPFMHKTHR